MSPDNKKILPSIEVNTWIYRPINIYRLEDELRGRYIFLGILTEMVGYNCFIIFQYYYLNIKILKFYENFEI